MVPRGNLPRDSVPQENETKCLQDNVPWRQSAPEIMCPGRQYALVYNVLWYTMCPGIQCALEDNAPQRI